MQSATQQEEQQQTNDCLHETNPRDPLPTREDPKTRPSKPPIQFLLPLRQSSTWNRWSQTTQTQPEPKKKEKKIEEERNLQLVPFDSVSSRSANCC